jgi:dolichol-phosphate mannosyltransferase
MLDDILFSLILPMYNESGCIGPLLREIIYVCMNDLRVNSEIIVVDDASEDTSAAIVENFISEMRGETEQGSLHKPIIKLIRHKIRKGQSGTLMDGFTIAQGKILVSMDADGQFDPREIPRLLERMDTFDFVCGVRQNRCDGLLRKIISLTANGFRNMITGDTSSDVGCTFRSMRRGCVEFLLPYQGKLSGCEFFFHPLILRKTGFRIGEVGVSHRPRSAGKSTYRLIRGRMGRGLEACIKVREMLGRK